MDIINTLLNAGNYVIFNKELARALGNEETILLMQYVYLKGLYGDGFYRTRPKLQSATNISSERQIKMDKKLENLGLISYKRKGIPPINHYYIHNDAIIQYINQLGQNPVIDSNSNESDLSKLKENPGIDSCKNPSQENKEKNKESFSKEKQSDSKESQRSKLKRRTSQAILAEDKPRPTLNKKRKLSKLREGDKSKPVPSPPLHIPERSLSFLAYWNEQASLPRILINPENPSKILKRVVKYLGQFFSGKLFNIHACVMPKNFCKDDWEELLRMKKEIDLKNFVDILIDAIESGEYFIPKCLNIETFLVGSKDTKTKHGEAFLTPSILVTHSFLEPDKLHKLPEHNPLLTEKLIKLWDKMVRNNSEKFNHEEFIKASNSIHNIYHDLEMDDRIELSMSGIFFGEVALAQRVRMMNSWRFEKSDISPKVFNSNWFKEKAIEVKAEFMGVR